MTIRSVLLIFLAALLPFMHFETSRAQETNISGRWQITIRFVRGETTHLMTLIRNNNELSGTYQGQYTSGEITGSIEDGQVYFSTMLQYQGSSLRYHFTGEVENETMSGTVDLGEYWTAEWTAVKL